MREALAALVGPVARLAVARGLPYAAVEQMLKAAFVQAADAAHPGLLPHRKTSRIATTTGINRREVARLQQAQPRAAARARSVAAGLFTHWTSVPPYSGTGGVPLVLPRLSEAPEAPSFETLAQSITRDVHPRSLLDELVRLRLANWDTAADTVTIAREAFVPGGDSARLLAFLGDNVGDHLSAAVANVLQHEPGAPAPHFEQAVLAEGLSAASMAGMRPAIREQWRSLMAALVSPLEARVEADAARPAEELGRLRVGLYSWFELPPPAAGAARPDTSTTQPARPRRVARRKPTGEKDPS